VLLICACEYYWLLIVRNIFWIHLPLCLVWKVFYTIWFCSNVMIFSVYAFMMLNNDLHKHVISSPLCIIKCCEELAFSPPNECFHWFFFHLLPALYNATAYRLVFFNLTLVWSFLSFMMICFLKIYFDNLSRTCATDIFYIWPMLNCE